MTPEKFVHRFVEPRIFPKPGRIYGHVLELTEDMPTGPWSRAEAEAAARVWYGDRIALLELHLGAIALTWSAAWPPNPPQEPKRRKGRGAPRTIPYPVEATLDRHWRQLGVAARAVSSDNVTPALLEAVEDFLPPLERERQKRGRAAIDLRRLALTLMHPYLRPWEVAYILDPKPSLDPGPEPEGRKQRRCPLPRSDDGRALLILYDRFDAPAKSLESFAKSLLLDPPWPDEGPDYYPRFFSHTDSSGRPKPYPASYYGHIRKPILQERYPRP